MMSSASAYPNQHCCIDTLTPAAASRDPPLPTEVKEESIWTKLMKRLWGKRPQEVDDVDIEMQQQSQQSPGSTETTMPVELVHPTNQLCIDTLTPEASRDPPSPVEVKEESIWTKLMKMLWRKHPEGMDNHNIDIETQRQPTPLPLEPAHPTTNQLCTDTLTLEASRDPPLPVEVKESSSIWTKLMRKLWRKRPQETDNVDIEIQQQSPGSTETMPLEIVHQINQLCTDTLTPVASHDPPLPVEVKESSSIWTKLMRKLRRKRPQEMDDIDIDIEMQQQQRLGPPDNTPVPGPPSSPSTSSSLTPPEEAPGDTEVALLPIPTVAPSSGQEDNDSSGSSLPETPSSENTAEEKDEKGEEIDEGPVVIQMENPEPGDERERRERERQRRLSSPSYVSDPVWKLVVIYSITITAVVIGIMLFFYAHWLQKF